MHLGPPPPLCNIDYNHNPKNPDSACHDAVCDDGTRALSSQVETEKTVDEPDRDDDAPEPDVHVCVKRDILVAFILEVVDVAQDGLDDEKHDNGYAEDRVEREELNHGQRSTGCKSLQAHVH